MHLYEIAPVNGLAAPDGRIFLTRGFYDRFRSGAVTGRGAGSVIAHELGHVALGHTRRRMIDFSGQNAVRAALAMVLGRIPPGVGVYIASALVGLDRGADEPRVTSTRPTPTPRRCSSRRASGPSRRSRSFRKLDGSDRVRARAATPAWLLSHPKTAERIAAIEANERKWLAT